MITIDVEKTSLLEQMSFVRVSGLTIYCDSKTFLNTIADRDVDLILTAYHETYRRFCECIFRKKKQGISLAEFPQATLVLTRSRDVFKAFYHTPEKYESLPEWVRGYVNFVLKTYVWYIPETEHIQISDPPDGPCHEFTHVVISELLGIPVEYLSKVWPTWVHEAYTVGCNQLCDISWTRRELHMLSGGIPSLEDIETNGIFFYDTRPPAKNAIYQYCYWVTSELGKLIMARMQLPGDKWTPLAAVAHLTQLAYDKEIPTLNDALAEYGIDLDLAERKCIQLMGAGREGAES